MNHQVKKIVQQVARLALFAIFLILTTGVFLMHQAASAQLVIPSTKATKAAQPVITAGFSRGVPSAMDVTLQGIVSADKSLYIAAYQFTNPGILRAVIAAKARGVDVEVVLDRSQAAGDSQAVLVSAGIPCRISTVYKIMHHKFMVIDGSAVETGSFNYSLNAVKGNAENALLIQNAPGLAIQYKAQWDTVNTPAKPCKGGGQ